MLTRAVRFPAVRAQIPDPMQGNAAKTATKGAKGVRGVAGAQKLVKGVKAQNVAKVADLADNALSLGEHAAESAELETRDRNPVRTRALETAKGFAKAAFLGTVLFGSYEELQSELERAWVSCASNRPSHGALSAPSALSALSALKRESFDTIGCSLSTHAVW